MMWMNRYKGMILGGDSLFWEISLLALMMTGNLSSGTKHLPRHRISLMLLMPSFKL